MGESITDQSPCDDKDPVSSESWKAQLLNHPPKLINIRLRFHVECESVTNQSTVFIEQDKVLTNESPPFQSSDVLSENEIPVYFPEKPTEADEDTARRAGSGHWIDGKRR